MVTVTADGQQRLLTLPHRAGTDCRRRPGDDRRPGLFGGESSD
jgi:hypothetical protein